MSAVLCGKRIVNTRAVHQARELDLLLERHGAIPLSYPCIGIEPPEDTRDLDIALRNLIQGRFDWLVFTSGNTVQAVADRCEAISLGSSIPERVSLAAVGPATARAVHETFDRVPHVVPDRHDGLALSLAMPVLPGAQVLVPGSDIMRADLARNLEQRGAQVESVVAYRTVLGRGGVDLRQLLREGRVDAITFASSSAVEGLFSRLPGADADISLTGIPSVCIGETTCETARRFGLDAYPAAAQTLEGMLETLERLFAPVGSGGTAWS